MSSGHGPFVTAEWADKVLLQCSMSCNYFLHSFNVLCIFIEFLIEQTMHFSVFEPKICHFHRKNSVMPGQTFYDEPSCQSLENSNQSAFLEILHPRLTKMCPVKILIRLHEWAADQYLRCTYPKVRFLRWLIYIISLVKGMLSDRFLWDAIHSFLVDR